VINQDWINRWDENRIGFHSLEYNKYLIKYFDKFSKSSSNIFLPLCGKSLDLLYLCDKVNKVIGVELSQKAINSFIKENNLKYKKETNKYFDIYRINNIDFYLGDFFNINIQSNDRLDIFDRASLVALNKKQRIKYTQKIKTILNGKMLLVTLEYPENEKKGPPFSVTKEEVYNLYSKDFNVDLLESINLKTTNDKLGSLSSAYERVFLIYK
jgi:thiopurine S-methyltransferase